MGTSRPVGQILAGEKPDKLFTDGEAYERFMGRWSRLVAEAFLDWLNVPNDLIWLDVGCGNGAFTEELIARCAPAAVTAIDPSDDQLAYARTRPSARMANFRAGDAQKLPFDKDTFDVAASALVIAFLPDPGAAVAEMARVVRPGGLVTGYMWDVPAGGVPCDPIYVTLESMGLIRYDRLTPGLRSGKQCNASGRTPDLKLSRRA